MEIKMRVIKQFFFVYLLIFSYVPIFSQAHTSVSLENKIYLILEQAEIRGLCSPLSGIRPYTRDVVISAIKEIISSKNSQKLAPVEREILEQHLKKFSKPKTGLDWKRGAYYGETSIVGENTIISMDIGISADIEGSAGFYSTEEQYWGTDTWIQGFLNGDMGKNFSYKFSIEGGLIQAPRKKIGKYWTYYEGFVNGDETTSEFVNREINVYSEPLTHFPYSYKKRWDGSVYFLASDLSYFESWPIEIAGSYNLLSEITASFLESKLMIRLGRLSHEWSSVPAGSSLVFNQSARPFLGIETEFNPVSWFGMASLTGALEYNNIFGIKESSMGFQNAFSITMMQFRYKNYIYFDFVDAVVYPKRFEPGYISPITNNFFYQNNVGDFDNMALNVNLKLQYPGLGNIWFSLFLDEINLTVDMLTLDRQMAAMQAGMSFSLPVLSFSSVKLSYTVVNPYCYTHNRNYNPWYGTIRMETAYVNNGVSLGYYLPPNSDEILIQFNTMPVKNITTQLKYQMIRHGADFGESAVDGSNLLSELDPNDRDIKVELKRFFLKDGAYQWQHIIKLGGEWTPANALAFYYEIGTVISYFTNTEEKANSGKAYSYSIIDTSEYPKSTGFIAKIGLRLYPK